MKKSALFVDFDNIFISLKNQSVEMAIYFATKPSEWLNKLIVCKNGTSNKFLVRKIYLNPVGFAEYRPNFIAAGFDVIDCPALTLQGKTAADMYLAIDVIDKLAHQTVFDNFLIMSADADFIPVLRKLREHNRETTVILAGPASKPYRASADVIINFADLYFTKENITEIDFTAVNDFEKPQLDDQRKSGVDVALSESETLATQDEVLKFISTNLQSSKTPIATAKILNLLSLEFGEQASRWFGLNQAQRFFDEIKISDMNIKFNPKPPGSLYISEIHGFLDAVVEDWISSDKYDLKIREVAAKVTNLTDVVCLSPSDFHSCFVFLSEKTQGGESLNFSEWSKQLRDFGFENGMGLSRSDAQRIINLINSSSNTLMFAQTTEEIIVAFGNSILMQCFKCQWNFSSEERNALYLWLSDLRFVEDQSNEET